MSKSYDEGSGWKSKLSDDDDDESNFEQEEDIFDDEGQVDSSNEHHITSEEQLPQVPKQQQSAFIESSPDLKKTLIAVDSPNGVRVAKAIRNIRTGNIKHLEALRTPTAAELQKLRTGGQKITNQSSYVDDKKGMSSLTKGIIGIGIVGSLIGLGVWGYNRTKDTQEEDED